MNVMIVDDDEMLIYSFDIVFAMNEIEITGKALNGKEALQMLPHIECDLALVDLNMRDMSGIELIKIIKEKYPEIKMLGLAKSYDEQNITEAIISGAEGYLLKDSGKETVLGVINQTMGGVSLIDHEVLTQLVLLIDQQKMRIEAAKKKRGRKPKPKNTLQEISDRERSICTLLADGLTNREIANELYISEGIVNNYISDIFEKTGINDRLRLVQALQAGRL